MSAKTKTVGEIVDITDRTEVEFPDGFTRTVSGTQLVLDRPGTYVIDGKPVQVKAAADDPESGTPQPAPAQS